MKKRKRYKYKAFLSYSHKDKAFSKWLHKRIENYKIPYSLREKYPNLPKHLKRSIFRDEDELPTASELSDNLLNALDNSEKLIVVCSPNSVASLWVDSEIAYFKQQHSENSVLAIIKSGEPNATYMDDAKNEAFPKALRYKVSKDKTLTDERTEPIAGDARSYFNKEMALIKIIAGVLKVDFADLWEREKREQTKRRGLFIAVIAIFIALAFYASTQFVNDTVNNELKKIKNDIAKIEYTIRHDNLSIEKIIVLNGELKKLKELKEAKEATLKILGLQKTSLGQEANIEYIHGGAVAAIKVLTSRDAKIVKEQRKKDFSLEEIALAKLYVETNQYDKAKESYESAITIFFDYENAIEYGYFLIKQNQFHNAIIIHERILKEQLSPHNRVTSLRRLATLYRKKFDFDRAEVLYLKAIKISKSIFETKSNIDKENYIKSLGSLAILYRDSKRFEQSEKYYAEALETSKNLANEDPDKYSSSYAITLSSSAVLYKRINKFKESEKRYLEASRIWRGLVKKNSDKYSSSLAITLSSLASLYKKLGRYEESKKNYIEASVIAKKLSGINPDKYSSSYAITLSSLAGLYRKMRNYKEAEITYVEAVSIFKYLVQRDPSVYSKSFMITLSGQGRLYHDMHKLELAKKVYNEEISLLKKMVIASPGKYNKNLKKMLNKLSVLNKKIKKK